MLNISLDENELKTIYDEALQKRLDSWDKQVQQRLDDLENQSMLLDMKELCKRLNLSRPTVEKLFIYDPKFPAIRVGKKWVFNRKEVEEYINRWSIDVKKKGGSVE